MVTILNVPPAKCSMTTETLLHPESLFRLAGSSPVVEIRTIYTLNRQWPLVDLTRAWPQRCQV